MADWRDVLDARSEALSALRDSDRYAGQIEDASADVAPLAVPLATRAIVLELRALGMVIDYALAGLANAVARA